MHRRQELHHQGAADCELRGFRDTGFSEVDTGDATDYTIRLVDPPDEAGGKDQ
ncbi:MAG: DUF1036 domain-containing protein [Hyphomicrobiaceae bacterium]